MRNLAILSLALSLPAAAWSYGGYYGAKTRKGLKVQGQQTAITAQGSAVSISQGGSAAPSGSPGGGLQPNVFGKSGSSSGSGSTNFQTNILSKPKVSNTAAASGASVPTGIATAAANASGPATVSAPAQNNSKQTCPSGQSLVAGACVPLGNAALGSNPTAFTSGSGNTSAILGGSNQTGTSATATNVK